MSYICTWVRAPPSTCWNPSCAFAMGTAYCYCYCLLLLLNSVVVVLRRAARLMGEPLYIFGDDVKDYFNHLENAPEELWKSVITFLGEEGDPDA